MPGQRVAQRSHTWIRERNQDLRPKSRKPEATTGICPQTPVNVLNLIYPWSEVWLIGVEVSSTVG